MLTFAIRYLFFLLTSFTFAIHAHSAPPGREYINALEDQLAALNAELSHEAESLERAKKFLAEAETSFEETSTDLEQAQLDVEENNSESAIRHLRVTRVKYRRLQNRVARKTSNVESKLKNISKLVEDIAAIQSDLTQLKVAAKKVVAPAKPKRAQAESKKVSKASPNNNREGAGKANEVDPTQAPADWPYLSNGSYQDKAFAAERLTELESKKQLGQLPSPPLGQVKISSSHSFNRVKMEYIGDNLYSAVAPVTAGKQLFEIFNVSEWHDIPATDDKQPYRFIFDVSSTSKPRLIIFNESLLEDNQQMNAGR